MDKEQLLFIESLIIPTLSTESESLLFLSLLQAKQLLEANATKRKVHWTHPSFTAFCCEQDMYIHTGIHTMCMKDAKRKDWWGWDVGLSSENAVGSPCPKFVAKSGRGMSSGCCSHTEDRAVVGKMALMPLWPCIVQVPKL